MAHSDSETSLAMQVQPSLPPPAPMASGPLRPFRFRRPRSDYVEDVRLYRPGGHHPINIGDVIRQRYRIIHKLGHGGFGLVWLARDLTQQQYVALKILRGDAPKRELTMLEYLKDNVPSLTMAHLRDTFNIRGVNANHRCLVVDFVGPSLEHARWNSEFLSMTFRKAAARKLAEGVASFHAAGICHGDLTDTNVLFQIEGIHDWTEEEIHQYLGPVKMESLVYEDGTPATSSFAPRDVVEPLDYSTFKWTELSSTPLLADFGEAFFISEPPEWLGSPPLFAAPERLFGYSPSTAVDLWALGCLIYEVSTFARLLPLFSNVDVEALATAISIIGASPQKWRYLYHDKTYYQEETIGETMYWFDTSVKPSRSLDILIPERLPNLSLEQQAALIDLLSQVLVFEPSHRLPAMEISKHTWFADT